MPKRSMRLSVVLGLTAFFLVAACAAQSASEAAIDPSSPSDEALSRSVSGHLAGIPGVEVASVTVSADGGLVTLSGAVAHLPARRAAVRIAQSVRGVRAVDDRLAVALSPPSAAELERRIRRALEADPAVDERTTLFEVSDGTVTVSGTVRRFADRALAEETIAMVRGVAAVRNEIAILSRQERSDPDIQAAAKDRLLSDGGLYDDAIGVHVASGVVHLVGYVGSAREFSRAFARSWVWGAASVDASGLSVVTWLDDDPNKDAAAPLIASDDAMAAAVSRELAAHPRVGPAVDVAVDAGVVALSGAVPSLAAKRAAEAAAANVVGVIRVVDDLAVRPAVPLSPVVIRSDVRDTLDLDPYLFDDDVAATVSGGTVTVAGSVRTPFEKARATAVAAKVAGVSHVQNDLTVTEPLDSTGAVLANRIRERLGRSALLDADDVVVDVEGGVPTLRGRVDSRFEASVAEDAAARAGARTFLNELEIDYGGR